MDALRYGPDYQERVRLRTGAPVVLRHVTPDDEAILARGFDELSPESRFRRFFTARERLTRQELAYLCSPDGTDHVAMGALEEETGRGLGIARFIRITDEPEVAEAAIAVIDAIHGQGLGTILLQRLSGAARERGIQRFRSTVLAENREMLGLLHDLSPETVEHTERGVVTVEVPLAPAVPAKEGEPATEKPPAISQLLRSAAEGTLRFLVDLLSPSPPSSP